MRGFMCAAERRLIYLPVLVVSFAKSNAFTIQLASFAIPNAAGIPKPLPSRQKNETQKNNVCYAGFFHLSELRVR
jgi:hypothetical protein